MSSDKSLVDKIPKNYNGFVKTKIVIYVHERDFLLLTVTNREPAFDAGYKIKNSVSVGCWMQNRSKVSAEFWNIIQ